MTLKFLAKMIETLILKRFFKISLTGMEEGMARDAILHKYSVAVRSGFLYSLLMIPALCFLDTAIVVSVLIPTTMVAGTAWFSVSLASMKKKFEDFGMELTRDLFVAFTLSLMMLFLATAFSLTSEMWLPLVEPYKDIVLLKLASALLTMIVVGKLLYSIFNGSLKYDVNDAMLTGQNEAAERFFKKSLSLLHTASEALKLDRGLEVANYTIGVAFFEVFTNISEIIGQDSEYDIDSLIGQANKLISEPSMKQKPADDISRSLIKVFLEICASTIEDGSNQEGEIIGSKVRDHKSYQAIVFELSCLEKNTEEQAMVDTRMSVIFSEIMELIEVFGPQLFED